MIYPVDSVIQRLNNPGPVVSVQSTDFQNTQSNIPEGNWLGFKNRSSPYS